MKKFILMLALSLGGIVSAQTFDFNCDEQITDNGGQTDSFSDVQDGFSDDQELGFSLSGFDTVELNNGSDVFRKAVEREGTTLVGDLSVNYGTFYNGRNEEQYGPGPFPYRIIGLAGPGTVDFYETAAEVAVALMIIDPNADAGNGFSYIEVALLDSYVVADGNSGDTSLMFTIDGGRYQHVVGDIYYYITVINGQYDISTDEDIIGVHDTLQEAIDYLLAL